MAQSTISRWVSSVPNLAQRIDLIRWRIRNLPRIVNHELRSGRLPLPEKLVTELRGNGIVSGSFQSVFGAELSLGVFERAARDALELSRSRGTVSDSAGSHKKEFRSLLLGNRIEIDNPFLEIALRPELLEIAGRYMGMRVYLRGLQLCWDWPTPGPPADTQLWHCDSDDVVNVKVFVYFTDVDMGGGPFCFVPRTHVFGDRAYWLAQRKGEGRTTDDWMAAAVPSSQWSVCTGGVGTVTICDTTGYHKGLKPIRSDRLMLIIQYTSGVPRYPRSFSIHGDLSHQQFTQAQLYALYRTTNSNLSHRSTIN